MRTPEELRVLLQYIEDNDDIIPDDVDFDGLLYDMVAHLGNPDPELRDDLIFASLNEFVDDGMIDAVQMRRMLDTCLSDSHLFHGVGESGTDTVYARSFSSLVIALAFVVHEDHEPFLTADDVTRIKKALLRYVLLEQDFRGFVDGQGWAHAVAHVADALGNLAGVENVVGTDVGYFHDRDTLLEILGAVKHLVNNKKFVYQTEEDERLVGVINSVLSNEVLNAGDIKNWLDNFYVDDPDEDDFVYPDDFYLKVNRKHFMRSLYFNFLECTDDEFDNVAVRELQMHLLEWLVEKDEDEE
ncbi:MAG: DUF2785 domain-containing protein [Defluviitaleaceae bacterium]|nr:DUF2785 domain-containing protein [Defluviitaleaceae bacterium]